MNINKIKDLEKNIITINFSGNLDFECVNEIKAELLKEFSENNEIVINLNNSSEIDLPVIQLFYSAYKTALLRKIKLVIKEKSNGNVVKKIISSSIFSSKKRNK